MTDPPTMPASVVHPSWGVNVETDEPATNEIPRVGAHRAPDFTYDAGGIVPQLGVLKLPSSDSPPLVQSTPVVIVAAMFFITMCVLIVTIAGDVRDAAGLSGLSVIIGTILAVAFRNRWK